MPALLSATLTLSGNMALLVAAVALIATLRGPWIMGGDFNLEPCVLEASGFLKLVERVRCRPLAPHLQRQGVRLGGVPAPACYARYARQPTSRPHAGHYSPC